MTELGWRTEVRPTKIGLWHTDKQVWQCITLPPTVSEVVVHGERAEQYTLLRWSKSEGIIIPEEAQHEDA